jgi:hypothetical protein
LPQNNRPIPGSKAITNGLKRGGISARGALTQVKPTYQGGGVNITYNPYEAMGLAKNEKGQIVRDQKVDINKNDYFKY